MGSRRHRVGEHRVELGNRQARAVAVHQIPRHIALVGLTHRSILGLPGLHRTVKEAARPHQARRPVRNYCCESDYFRQRPGNLSRANLSGAYLAGADLHEADLRSATLAGALLENTRLSFAHLGDADLGGGTSSSWRGIQIRAKTDLRAAALDNVSLRGLDLRCADLADARLTGVFHDDRTIWPEGFTPPTQDAE